MSLPNSPSDCHAPFTSPVAKELYPKNEWRLLDTSGLTEITEDDRKYALAQQAEFRDKHLHHMASELVAMAEHDFDENSWAALLKLTEQAKLILPYLNPPTP